MIGIFYGNGVNQENWGRMVLVMLGLCAVTFVVALLWRERKAGEGPGLRAGIDRRAGRPTMGRTSTFQGGDL
jgi:hypothetical protein